jgi:putative flippase GtrA
MGNGIILVIPAYHPSERLPQLLGEIFALDTEGSIEATVIIDDGSPIAHAHTFEQLGAMPRVTILRHAVNLGMGAALKTAFNYALVTWPEARGIVAADADCQHAPVDILHVASTLALRPDSIVLGCRQFGPDVPLRSRFGNIMTRYVFLAFTGKRVSDTQTGLRGWSRESCMRTLRIPLNGFDFQLECLLRAEAPVCEVPIKTIYLEGNRSSHFNPVRDSMRIYFLFLRYCASSLFAALVDSAVFYPVYYTTGNLAASQFAGRAAAVCLNFPVVSRLVFQSRQRVFRPLLEYLALAIASGLMSYGLIEWLHTREAVPVPVAKILSEGLLFLGNFTIQRDFIFSRRKQEPTPGGE